MNDAIRVLHVEDDASFAELTAAFLQRENDGLTVETAADADEGMARLAEAEFDCIVSDYEMPGMDGIEFLQAVRERHPDVPFVLFTGKGSEEVASDALSAGATDYLQKGSTDRFTLLSNRILNVVEQYRERQRRTALERVRTIVSDVNQALVHADSREGAEQRVCELLADTAPYRFAAFVDADDGEEGPRCWAGTGKPLFDAVEPWGADGPERAPSDPHAASPDDVTVCQNVQSAAAYEPWQDLAATEGVASVAVVPLRYEGTSYGLLTLFADCPDAFDAAERELLAGLGDDIGHALASLDAREALASEKERFRLLAESAMDGIVSIDEDSVVRFANPAVEEIFGYSPEELVGEPLTKLMPEPYQERHMAAVARYLETGERTSDWSSTELPGLRKDGERIDLSISFSAFEEQGEVRFEGILRDITERKRRQRELERHETITETIRDGICILNRDSEFLVVNDAFTELTGYARDELVGSHASMVRPARLDTRFEEIQAALENGSTVESIEMEIERADGERRVVDGRYAEFDGEVQGRLGVWRDVTENRDREERLERYRAYTERMLDAIDDVFFVFDREGRLQRWNTAFSEATGYADEELDGMDVLSFISESDVEKTRAAFEEVFETGRGRLEASILPKDGEPIPYEYAADRVEHPDGGHRLVGIGRNIAQRKRREQELAESERRYRTLAENFPNGGVFLLDDELRYQLVSGTGFESLSLSPEDLVGQCAGEVAGLPTELQVRVRDAYERALAGDQVTTEVTTEDRTYDLRATPIRNDAGEVTQVLAITQDVTERIDQQETLERQNARLNEFADIVSHDLRNPLNVADGRVELAQEECDSEHLDPAKTAIERSQALIDDLLTLARQGQQASDIEWVDVDAVAVGCWRNVPTADATLTVDATRTVRANPSRLEQLFENLFRNSVEHSSTGSRPGADDSVDHGDGEVTVTVGDLADGFFVADDGPGIPDDTRDEVFEPGYTTAREGTGYGLSIVKQVADAHGWDVTLTESASGGVRFEFSGADVE